jgi:hypothetical protein
MKCGSCGTAFRKKALQCCHPDSSTHIVPKTGLIIKHTQTFIGLLHMNIFVRFKVHFVLCSTLNLYENNDCFYKRRRRNKILASYYHPQAMP